MNKSPVVKVTYVFKESPWQVFGSLTTRDEVLKSFDEMEVTARVEEGLILIQAHY